MVSAYVGGSVRTDLHEPALCPGWGPNDRRHTYVEELATEAAAQQISGDLLGFGAQAWYGYASIGYQPEISAAVQHVCAVTGCTEAQGHAALVSAALDYKRRDIPRGVSWEVSLRYLSSRVLAYLGQPTAAREDDLTARLHSEAATFGGDRYRD